MGVLELKAYLRQRHVDFSGCCEKGELLALAQSTLTAPVPAATAATPRSPGEAAATAAIARAAAAAPPKPPPPPVVEAASDMSHLSDAWKPGAAGVTMAGVRPSVTSTITHDPRTTSSILSWISGQSAVSQEHGGMPVL
jgi:hypothetical protein